MFENFGSYLFSLLFGPLKKKTKPESQLGIFFRVIGREFDDLKQALFKMREESNVVSCSDIMLQIHGQDRDMARLAGESLESYRTRLSMKALIAEKAGTSEGIRYLAKSLQYDDVEITPHLDPSRWAEVSVCFISRQSEIKEKDVLLKELNKIKPARTMFNLSIRMEKAEINNLYVGCTMREGKHITIGCEIPPELDVIYLTDENGDLLTDENGARIII